MKSATMMMMREKGKFIYKLYRAVTFSLTPLIHLHLRFRKFRGLEHSLRWPERLGRPSLNRPPGPLLWFHAVSLGEGMAAIPVIRRCLTERPDINILMTTTTLAAFEVLKHKLPLTIIYQMALVLLNARMSERSFKHWSAPAVLPLIALMLSKFSLIMPLSTAEAIRFQLLQAPPFIVNISADLKYCVGEITTSTNALKGVEQFLAQLNHREVWMASSVHKGEHEVMLRVHKTLVKSHPKLLTVIVPRHPHHGLDFSKASKKLGLTIALRSDGGKLTSATNIYVANTLGELRELYRLMPISVIGGSFLPTSSGHNIAEAMAAGSAVITGPHVGHFSHMVSAMQSFNPLSILQVSGEAELIKSLHELLSDPLKLEARQTAAKQAFHALSFGILSRVWIQLDWFILKRLPV